MIGEHPKGKIVKVRGDGEGPLAGSDRSVAVTHPEEAKSHVGQNAPQPPLIAQRLGQGLGRLQMVERPFDFSLGI